MKWQFLLSIKIKGPENTLKEIKIENIYLKTFVKRSMTQFYTPICNTKVQHKLCMNRYHLFLFFFINSTVRSITDNISCRIVRYVHFLIKVKNLIL